MTEHRLVVSQPRQLPFYRSLVLPQLIEPPPQPLLVDYILIRPFLRYLEGYQRLLEPRRYGVMVTVPSTWVPPP